MSVIQEISGKVLIDHKSMIRLLSKLTPTDLTRDSNLFDVGYEKAKSDIMSILHSGLGTTDPKSLNATLIREIRNG